MSDRSSQVGVRVEGEVGWVVIDNLRRHNAMTLQMWEALRDAIGTLETDPAVRVIVLRGAGDEAFVSGADISQFNEVRDSVQANVHYENVGNESMARLAVCPKPTIGMLQGWCLGGGMALALNCDLRIASDTLRYGIPAARLGIGYRWTGIKRLVDTVGASFAREIMLTGKRFHADDAMRMGFVGRVVPQSELETAVREECAILAANAPLTMASVKLAIDELQREGEQVDVARIEAATHRAFASADFIEGRHAFMEKRLPRFTGC